jgi:hypothetical protein
LINKKYNIDYKPLTYWGEIESILSNIKGQKRRNYIADAIKNNENIPKEILQNELSEETREAIGKIHPSYMGGEYLPNSDKNEIEIARICYESVTADVMSVRAKLGKNDIIYNIVDEYEQTWEVTPHKSKQPLTLRELIMLIQTAFILYEDYPCKMLLDGTFFRNYLWEWESREQIEGFFSVSSDFYSDLSQFFNELEGKWLDYCENSSSNERQSTDEEIYRKATGKYLLNKE